MPPPVKQQAVPSCSVVAYIRARKAGTTMQPRNIEGSQRSEEVGERPPWLKLGGWTVFGLAVLWALFVVSSRTVRDIRGAWAGGSSRSAAMKEEKLRQRRDSPSILSAKVCACLHAYCVVCRFERQARTRTVAAVRSGGLPSASPSAGSNQRHRTRTPCSCVYVLYVCTRRTSLFFSFISSVQR